MLLILSIPVLVPPLHELSHFHRYHHCDDSNASTHLHEGTFDCKLCDYLITLKVYHEQQGTIQNALIVFVKNNWTTHSSTCSSQPATQHLRGPPSRLA